MISEKEKIKHMEAALDLAARAENKTYPNPMVGALIVKGGKVLGKGYHMSQGKAHAEINAIKDAGAKCLGASLYVTLEPCNHFGRTPPCTDAIIKAGIKKVYMAMKDPNPLNNGKGVLKLRKAGIVVLSGLCEDKAMELNRKYVKYIKYGLPYITVKIAHSLDGKSAARDGSSKWISSKKSRDFVKKIRPDYDAVLVGINTVIEDDPFLLKKGRASYEKTVRIVLDSRLRMPLNSNLLKTAGRSSVIIGTTEKAPKNKFQKISGIPGVELIRTKSKNGKVSLKSFFKSIARKGFVNIFVESGGELAGALLDQDLCDEVLFFIAPKLIGGPFSSVKGEGVRNIKSAIRIKYMDAEKIGDDILLKGRVCSRG